MLWNNTTSSSLVFATGKTTSRTAKGWSFYSHLMYEAPLHITRIYAGYCAPPCKISSGKPWWKCYSPRRLFSWRTHSRESRPGIFRTVSIAQQLASHPFTETPVTGFPLHKDRSHLYDVVVWNKFWTIVGVFVTTNTTNLRWLIIIKVIFFIIMKRWLIKVVFVIEQFHFALPLILRPLRSQSVPLTGFSRQKLLV